MIKYLLTLLVLINGCGMQHSSKRVVNPVTFGKSDLYVNKLQEANKQDESGFILSDKCDSLLFTGLLSAARPDLNIKIREAQDVEGAWHRRPAHDCGPEFGNSRSTISRDMLLGLYWHIWKHKDVLLAKELMDDLKANLYFLEGDGTPGELFVTPALMNTLAQMIKAMDGSEYTAELLFPVTYSEDTGFIAHLAAWHIALRGDILGYITDSELEIITSHKNRQPLNPLFQAIYSRYTDGNQEKATALLSEENEWPSDRLPNTINHCDEFVIQRDFSDKDWGPCEPMHEHTGAALVVVYELLIKEI